jgi:hypothetical protein
MSTTVQKQVLINARALIADRAHWTRVCVHPRRRAEWWIGTTALRPSGAGWAHSIAPRTTLSLIEKSDTHW